MSHKPVQYHLSVWKSFSGGCVHSHEHCACVDTECCVNLYFMLSVLGNSNTGGQSIEYSIFFFLYSEKKL